MLPQEARQTDFIQLIQASIKKTESYTEEILGIVSRSQKDAPSLRIGLIEPPECVFNIPAERDLNNVSIEIQLPGDLFPTENYNFWRKPKIPDIPTSLEEEMRRRFPARPAVDLPWYAAPMLKKSEDPALLLLRSYAYGARIFEVLFKLLLFFF
jgi:hypothetical protein